MITCYRHGDGTHVQYAAEHQTYPICRALLAKDEAIAALSKLSEEEEQAIAFLREPTDERFKQNW